MILADGAAQTAQNRNGFSFSATIGPLVVMGVDHAVRCDMAERERQRHGGLEPGCMSQKCSGSFRPVRRCRALSRGGIRRLEARSTVACHAKNGMIRA